MRNALLKTTAEAAKRAAAAAPQPPQRKRLGGRSRAVAQQASAAAASEDDGEDAEDGDAAVDADGEGEGGDFYCSDDFHQRLLRLLATGQADGLAAEATDAAGSWAPESSSSLCVLDVEAELEPLAFESFLQQ